MWSPLKVSLKGVFPCVPALPEYHASTEAKFVRRNWKIADHRNRYDSETLKHQ